MKKRVVLFSLLFLLLCSCNEEINFKHNFEENDTSIMIISDSHYISKSLLDEEANFDVQLIADDGRTVQYNTVLMDQAIEKAIQEKVDYFIVTGDLTFNGEKASHEELASKFNRLIDKNIQPLVIPGNHDVFNFNAREYKNQQAIKVDYINDVDFKNIYKNAGYLNAYSYDENSLSYIVETKNNEWLLMLDTTLSKYNMEQDMVLIGGSFSSLTWLEENLKYAQEHNINCISFSHHNLVNHNPNFTSLYDIHNKDQLLELYQKYDVNLHFSGHLHIQDIKENNGIFDIVNASLVDYGNRYGLLKLHDNVKEYVSRNLDFKMEDNRDFSDYSKDLFYRINYQKFQYRFYYFENEKDKETAVDYLARVNLYYFNGEIYRLYKKLIKERGYSLIKNNTENFENSYIYTMLEYGNNENWYLLIK